MNQEQVAPYFLNLGIVFRNLVHRDLLVRVAVEWLDEQGEQKPIIGPYGEGEWVRRTPITDPDPLGPMLIRFNELVPEEDRLDVERLVRLRDTLAHGRIASRELNSPMDLVKFARKPDSAGRIQVETVLVMTDQWFEAQKNFTNDARARALKYCQGPTGRRP